MTTRSLPKWSWGVTLGGVAFFVWLFYLLTPILTPFLIAVVIAYFSDPLVEWLSSFHRFKFPRTAAVLGVFALVGLLLFLLLFLVLPALQQQCVLFIKKIPLMMIWIQEQLIPWLVTFGFLSEALTVDKIKDQALQHTNEVAKVAEWVWHGLFYSGGMILTVIMNCLIVVVVGFYLLRDWPQIVTVMKKSIPAFASKHVFKIVKQCDEVLSTFLRGQLTVMLALGALYSVGLMFIGVHFSLLLGIMAGILSVVPYLGSILGLGAALLVAFFQFSSGWPLVGVLIVFGIGHALEMMVLTPILIGDKLGLHPVVVIFSVLAGGHLMGLAGVIVALPLTAVMVVLVREWLSYLK